MFKDYGYAEEGQLGKPYNFRLLKRLARFAIAYRKSIAVGLLLSILISLFALTVPYLTKIAIDQYIVASWYRIDSGRLTDPAFRDLKRRYGHLLETNSVHSVYYISNINIKKIDPADLHLLRTQGLLSSERFYRLGSGVKTEGFLEENRKAFDEMTDGSFLIPYDLLERLPEKTILKIRAGDVHGVALIAAIFFFLLLLSLGISYMEYYILEFTGQRIMLDIRLSLFRRMQFQSLRFFDRHPIGRLVTRVTNDIENLNEMFKSVFITVFKDLFILLGILIILLYLNWKLALICFTLLPVIFCVTFIFSSMAREAFRQLRTTVAKINGFLQERISGMQVIQMFVREKFQMDAFSRINHENYLAGIKQIRVFALFMPAMELFSSLAIAFLIWHGGGKVIQEELTLGTLVAFISYIQMFFKPIRDISEKYNIMQLAMASTERIFEFMDSNEIIPEPESPKAPANIKVAMGGHLVFDRVSFGYDKDRPVLHDISFEVKPGETTAIVGATGSGKTTVVNLVERFYDPDEGSVILDGIDLRKWSNAKLRGVVSLCMQDVFIFAGKLGDNISLGREELNSEAIGRAAETANALSFIERLPGGFTQELGEGGASLSAGERQLLSFARALANNPRLLILDEATSSVDPETERLIQEAISQMAQKRTTLIVAHRLSTIRKVDRILVMHHGRIREQGTHKELMDLGGIYFRLNRVKSPASSDLLIHDRSM
ncbi:MAG: ABC transporter ATP-binding protein [Deltaproteobacteria bacterium]|nr:ABC transporter ATP-binding protein [Deltaproteobacteria bacterium]